MPQGGWTPLGEHLVIYHSSVPLLRGSIPHRLPNSLHLSDLATSQTSWRHRTFLCGLLIALLAVRMDGWKIGWMNGWMDGWIDGSDSE